MTLKVGENVIVANIPEEIANSTHKVYNDEGLCNMIRDDATKFVNQAWGEGIAWETLKI